MGKSLKIFVLVALVLSVFQPLAPKAAVTTVKTNALTEESADSFAEKLESVKNYKTKAAIGALAPNGLSTDTKVAALATEVAAETVVNFNDAALEEAVRWHLELEEGAPITAGDMENIYELWVYEAGVSDLTGLEYAINLQHLFLTTNDITDLKPISGLTNLIYLELSDNPIDSLEDLAGLVHLKGLGFSNTNVTDISLLLDLQELEHVSMWDLPVDWEDANVKSVIEALEGRNVEVYYGEILPFEISEVIAGETAIAFSYYYTGNANSEDVMMQISLDGQEYDTIGLYEDSRYVVKGLQPETEYTIELKALVDGVPVDEKTTKLVVTTSSAPTGNVITFEDSILEQAVKEHLLIENRDVRESDMLKLKELNLSGLGIYSLQGLENAVNLEFLSVSTNEISDFSPLVNLTQLKNLDASENNISDLQSFSKLVNLEELILSYNSIEDITPLKDLKNLKSLSLWDNQISNITNLKYLTGLESIDLDDNQVSDISALASLSELSAVWLSNNKVTDISPLKYLSKLNYLNLQKNPIDLSEGSKAREVLNYLEENNEYFEYSITTVEFKNLLVGNRVIAVDWDLLFSEADEFRVYLEKTYYEEEEEYEEVEPIVLGKDQTHYIFTDLQPNTEYGVWVEAFNEGEHVGSEYAYVVTTDTATVNGFIQMDGKTYFYNAVTGKLLNGWINHLGKWYFLADGKLKTGWFVSGTKTYYLDAKGVMLTGWLTLGSNKYYLGNDGAMVKGWMTEAGKKYYFDNNGVLVKGWKQIASKWYFLDANGVTKVGWLEYNKKWYYLDANGAMLTGWAKVGGAWYYLESSGVMKTGWLYYGGQWYYLNTNGTMAIGWKQINKKWYYFYTSGKMAKSTTINGYRLGKDGAWY